MSNVTYSSSSTSPTTGLMGSSVSQAPWSTGALNSTLTPVPYETSTVSPSPSTGTGTSWKYNSPAYVSFGGSSVSNSPSPETSIFADAGNSLGSFFKTPAGIGAGAGIGAAILVFLISLCVCLRRRKRRRRLALPMRDKPPRLPPRRRANDQLDLLGDTFEGDLSASNLELPSPVSPLDPVQLRHARSYPHSSMPYESSQGSHYAARASTGATDSEFDAFAVDGSSLARTLTNTSTSDVGWRAGRHQRRRSDAGSSPPASLHRVMRYAGTDTPSGTFGTFSAQSQTIRTPLSPEATQRSVVDPFRNPSPPPTRGYPGPPPTESDRSVRSYRPGDEDVAYEQRVLSGHRVSVFGGSENDDQERYMPPSYVDLYDQDGLRRV